MGTLRAGTTVHLTLPLNVDRCLSQSPLRFAAQLFKSTLPLEPLDINFVSNSYFNRKKSYRLWKVLWIKRWFSLYSLYLLAFLTIHIYADVSNRGLVLFHRPTKYSGKFEYNNKPKGATYAMFSQNLSQIGFLILNELSSWYKFR